MEVVIGTRNRSHKRNRVRGTVIINAIIVRGTPVSCGEGIFDFIITEKARD